MSAIRFGFILLPSVLLQGCLSVDCGPGTHLEGSTCTADAGDSAGEADADTDADADGDSDTDTAYGETGPCAPTDTWTGPVPGELLTSTPFETAYDAGIEELLVYVHGYGAGSMDAASIVSGATVVAVGEEPRYEGYSRYYVGDGYATLPVDVQGVAVVGDRVTFAVSGYEGLDGVPLANRVGSWTVNSASNLVPARHLGAATVDYTDHYSELVHEAGELVEPSSLDCGTGYTCFVFEHDGVRDKLRLPALNDFGLDVDYDGGLCAEVIAPSGIYQNSSGVQGYFIDVPDATWMRVWDAP